MVSTVTIARDDQHRALHMTWARNVRHEDVTDAFETLVACLDGSAHPVFVIVDLTSRPVFPMLHTTFRALPAFGHRNLGCWLVVGESSLGRMIEDTLMNVSRRKDCVKWFASLPDVYAHIEQNRKLLAAN